MKYAVFAAGAKQYLVSEGDTLLIDSIETKKDGPVELDKVLLSVDEKNIEIGKPYLKSKVTASVLDHVKGKKLRVYKYKAKTGYNKTIGHRQNLTKIKIEKV